MPTALQMTNIEPVPEGSEVTIDFQDGPLDLEEIANSMSVDAFSIRPGEDGFIVLNAIDSKADLITNKNSVNVDERIVWVADMPPNLVEFSVNYDANGRGSTVCRAHHVEMVLSFLGLSASSFRKLLLFPHGMPSGMRVERMNDN